MKNILEINKVCLGGILVALFCVFATSCSKDDLSSLDSDAQKSKLQFEISANSIVSTRSASAQQKADSIFNLDLCRGPKYQNILRNHHYRM